MQNECMVKCHNHGLGIASSALLAKQERGGEGNEVGSVWADLSGVTWEQSGQYHHLLGEYP